MPKLQILLDKGKVTFNNNNNNWKRFRLFNFPCCAILDFMTSLRCLYCLKAEVLLFETIGQRSDVIKSKMAARGKFKSRNLFHLLLLNVMFPLSSNICNLGIIWSNLGSTPASALAAEVPFKCLFRGDLTRNMKSEVTLFSSWLISGLFI